MRSVTVLASLLIGAGMAAAATAGLSYLTRYSMFDALIGEIDPTLYLRITGMTPFERTAIVVGLAAVVMGLVLAVVRFVVIRRARM
ncbi:hypothetical protein [Clavibacter michiganensis]|uniref:hypothetical protein n=1 Tax=Clavibacter michiganensis TaxID=28447 RepID=UPI0005BE1831|nr:hypothetical protein [Clavibacter michiganensis]